MGAVAAGLAAPATWAWGGAADGPGGAGVALYIVPPERSPARERPRGGSRFFKTLRAEKQIKEILNGRQKSRNKFSPSSKNNPDKMNIYLGLKCNFEKHTFFLNSNKIAIKLRNKILFDFNIKSPIFLYFGKSFYSLSFSFT